MVVDSLLYKKEFPLQSFYKFKAGKTSEAPLRNGVIEEYVPEYESIQTIKGKEEFIPIISIYMRTTHANGALDIYITEKGTHQFIREFVISSNANGWTLSDLKDKYNAIIKFLDENKDTACVKLQLYLKDKKNKINFEQYG